MPITIVYFYKRNCLNAFVLSPDLSHIVKERVRSLKVKINIILTFCAA